MANLCAASVTLMLTVRHFKAAFEKVPCEVGYSSEATAGSIGFVVSTGR